MENRYAADNLATTVELQRRLFEEIKARSREDDSTVTAPDGPFAYYRRFVIGGQHPILCRYRLDAGEKSEEILLHGDKEAEGLKYLNITTSHHRPRPPAAGLCRRPQRLGISRSGSGPRDRQLAR
jgi:oligopeptidase B